MGIAAYLDTVFVLIYQFLPSPHKDSHNACHPAIGPYVTGCLSRVMVEVATIRFHSPFSSRSFVLRASSRMECGRPIPCGKR